MHHILDHRILEAARQGVSQNTTRNGRHTGIVLSMVGLFPSYSGIYIIHSFRNILLNGSHHVGHGK